ncbi:MAG: hypothetical protein AAB633_01405 [Patescibacteria group bacterium]
MPSQQGKGQPMSNKQAVVVAVAVVAFGLLTAFSARWARGEEPKKSPVILHFWRTTGDAAEMVDLTIPRVSAQCPDGFTPTDNPGFCGRDVLVWVSVYDGGERLNREEMRLRYRQSESGYWEPYVRIFAGLREIEVEPFSDASGLRHRVVGTLWVRFNQKTNTWRVERRESEQTFFAETERGFPFIRLLECVTGEEPRTAALLN